MIFWLPCQQSGNFRTEFWNPIIDLKKEKKGGKREKEEKKEKKSMNKFQWHNAESASRRPRTSRLNFLKNQRTWWGSKTALSVGILQTSSRVTARSQLFWVPWSAKKQVFDVEKAWRDAASANFDKAYRWVFTTSKFIKDSGLHTSADCRLCESGTRLRSALQSK